MKSYSDCYGCSLCLLSCPVWLQRRDVRFSAQGYAKAMQHGADADAMAKVLPACIQCGACDVLCPEKIGLTAWIGEEVQKAQPAGVVRDGYVADCFELSCAPAVRQGLRVDDLYIIDACVFHSNHAKRVGHYESLRQHTGCSMNLDLNRMAIPTGIGSLSVRLQCFDVRKQIEWLMQGRSVQRIIVENPADQALLAEMTGKPVLHVSELIEYELNRSSTKDA